MKMEHEAKTLQEKNDGFRWGAEGELLDSRRGGKGGRGEGGAGDQNDALGPRVQEHFEFSLYLMK